MRLSLGPTRGVTTSPGGVLGVDRVRSTSVGLFSSFLSLNSIQGKGGGETEGD